MPFNWTPASERQMLLIAIRMANLRPTGETWAAIALELGNGLTPSAVSQKYNKLRNDSAALRGDSETSLSQATPKKRKHKSGPQTIRGEYEEIDDLNTVMIIPQRLIADRPHNKIHRDDPDGQVQELAQANPNKKRKVKCEEVDGECCERDSDYVP